MAEDKAIEIIEKIRALDVKRTELLDELQAVLEAEPTKGQNAKRLLDYFVKHWERQYRPAKMVVNGAKDMASFKRLLGQLSADEVAARVVAYFKGQDKFVVDARHSLPVFVSRINELSSVPIEGAQLPIGCAHQPPCRDDAEHTRKQLVDRRQAR